VPYEVGTESNGFGVIVSFSGVVSGPELLDLNLRLTNEESFAQCRYQVWDFSTATRLDISADEIRAIAMQDISGSAINPTLNIAIVGEAAFFANRDRIFLIFEEVWTAFRPKFFTDFEVARKWASNDEPNS
jgi:hypothetical protein